MTLVVIEGRANRKHFYKGKWYDFAVLIHQRTKSEAHLMAWRGNILPSAGAKEGHFTRRANFSSVHLASTCFKFSSKEYLGCLNVSLAALFVHLPMKISRIKMCLVPKGIPCNIKCSLLTLFASAFSIVASMFCDLWNYLGLKKRGREIKTLVFINWLYAENIGKIIDYLWSFSEGLEFIPDALINSFKGRNAQFSQKYALNLNLLQVCTIF